ALPVGVAEPLDGQGRSPNVLAGQRAPPLGDAVLDRKPEVLLQDACAGSVDRGWRALLARQDTQPAAAGQVHVPGADLDRPRKDVVGPGRRELAFLTIAEAYAEGDAGFIRAGGGLGGRGLGGQAGAVDAQRERPILLGGVVDGVEL